MALEELDYSVHKYSSFSPGCLPCNIKEDKPNDQTSRWSSESNIPPQFLLLKLSKYAIVRAITFGKFEKTRVCNLKKFKIFGGLDEENMLELLDGGLKNDCTPETFDLKYELAYNSFALRYIKIVPLQSWGFSFNFTVWFVKLVGVTHWPTVESSIRWLNNYRQWEAVRVCMKFLRRLQLRETYECLERETRVQLEDPFLSRIYGLTASGSYNDLEELLVKCVKAVELKYYLNLQQYKPTWRSIHPPKPRPGMRGGHQMCLDSVSESIYLFGGWDGYQDLADFWVYHIPSKRWTLLSDNTKAQGGPSARSCHKMCLDPERREIYLLGRYIDTHLRSQSNMKSDFYVFNIESREWTLISNDTSAMKGPLLIFDHQMCMDVSSRILYVFGGRILLPTLNELSDEESGGANSINCNEPMYSGLYSYHILTNTWNMIGSDFSMALGSQPLKSRVGHSMLFHPVSRKLYIFAGQRNKGYLDDFFTFDIDSKSIEYIHSKEQNQDNFLPAAGCTQRATIDPDLDQIYVLTGLSKEKDKREDNVQNSFWVYYIKENKWSCVYNHDVEELDIELEPCPRFAHQLIYDPVSKLHYLFGGNPGVSAVPKLRLDDFWKLHFYRRTNAQVQRGLQLIIRTQRFKELAQTDQVEALRYLQNEVKEMVDSHSPIESEEFQRLPGLIFHDELSGPSFRKNRIYEVRNDMFEKICSYFPDTRVAPRINLEQIIPL